ncbi:hypothetical protein A2U01_0102358, partial [Trifolium medium]|nr:hypothetical protein [Trifolium medium]
MIAQMEAMKLQEEAAEEG